MKYTNEVYDAMKPVYEEFLDDKNDKKELIELVDEYDKYTLFHDLCEWHGMKPTLVEHVYETCYGRPENKTKGFFCI